MDYKNIKVTSKESVGIIEFNKEKAMNAVCSDLIKELYQQLDIFENDESINCIIITGNEKAFAAGIDIKELANNNSQDAYLNNFMNSDWLKISKCRKPIIAAVAGFAIGAGCEIALMCDFIIAADNAKFGQPEVSIGVIPGLGATQRLTKTIGKAKTMDMVLTGRNIEADEADRIGLVSRVVALSDLMDEAMDAASRIGKMSKNAVLMAKEAVNSALNNDLNEGLNIERKLSYISLDSDDKEEGIKAIVEKRAPKF